MVEKSIPHKISINIEELRRLKQAKKEAKKLMNSKPPQAQEPPLRVLERSFANVPQEKILKEKTGAIRAMSFNLLAQGLIKRELFPDSGHVLKWKNRRKMILDEIKLYEPDILTLQELDNLDQYYQEEFSKMGYETKYYKHETKVHGCGIAYKKEKFNLIDYDTIDYNTDPTCPPSFLTGNIGQLIALEYVDNPKTCFVVGNTHLYWRPSANYERYRQGIIFSNRLLELKSKLEQEMENRKWILFLFGDFNTTPDEAAYPLLTENKLREFHINDLQESLAMTMKDVQEAKDDEEVGNISIENLDTIEELTNKYRQCEWKSIYSHFGKIDPQEGLLCDEPKFTNYTVCFKGTLDYMFIEKEADLVIKRILMMPREEALKPSLPNTNFGSDHLCLVCDIEF